MLHKKKEKKQRRIISATQNQWDDLVSVLFKMGISVPTEEFDFELYSNSLQSLKHLKAESFNKLEADTRYKLFLRIAEVIGLHFAVKDDKLCCTYNDNMSGKDLFRFRMCTNQKTKKFNNQSHALIEQIEQIDE